MVRLSSRSIAILLAGSFISFTSMVSASAATTLLTQMTGAGGTVQYDFARNPNNGWYVESGQPYRFKLGFKQGERASAHPVEVATVTVDPQEPYQGTPSIALQIIARRELRRHSTAYYKVSVSSKQAKDPFKLPLLGGGTFVHSFAMKIDPKSSIEDGAPVIFEQFWQGSPFAAPVSLIMFSPNDARGMSWPDVGAYGNFAIKLNDDDHRPLHKFSTENQYVDLGPIVLGTWMTWQVRVTPSPSKSAGMVQVFYDGKQVAFITHHKVGFDPKNPQYSEQKPSNQFDDVDILLYRDNGDSFQRVYFDDVRLTVIR